jgi:hypothetical protein
LGTLTGADDGVVLGAGIDDSTRRTVPATDVAELPAGEEEIAWLAVETMWPALETVDLTAPVRFDGLTLTGVGSEPVLSPLAEVAAGEPDVGAEAGAPAPDER